MKRQISAQIDEELYRAGLLNKISWTNALDIGIKSLLGYIDQNLEIKEIDDKINKLNSQIIILEKKKKQIIEKEKKKKKKTDKSILSEFKLPK